MKKEEREERIRELNEIFRDGLETKEDNKELLKLLKIQMRQELKQRK